MRDPTTAVPTGVQRLMEAINGHDLGALVACFTPEYQSEFPVHPDRAFRRRDRGRANWSAIFTSVPDIRAEVLRSSTDDDSAWAEWDWTGTQASGTSFLHRGVTLQGVQQGRIVRARLYMEPVQADGQRVDYAIRQARQ